MKTQISIEKVGDEFHVVGPYSPSNIATFKARGARWAKPAWRIPATPPVEELLNFLFGASTEVVEAEVNFTHDEVKENDGELFFFGYLIATRRSRDSNVQTAPGVRLWAGEWRDSGGSVAHPSVLGRGERKALTVRIVVRKDFAEAKNLKIVSAEPPAPTAAAEVAPPAMSVEEALPVLAKAQVDPRFVALVQHCLATLNLSDSDHADFVDSGTDTLDFFWGHENEIKALAAAFGLMPSNPTDKNLTTTRPET